MTVDDFDFADGLQGELGIGEAEEAFMDCSLGEDAGRSPSTDLRPIRFGMLNISGLAGQAHLPERILRELDLDFLFLSETWTGPGGCQRLCPWTIHAQELDTRSNGRHHYGQCLIVNQARLGLDQVEVVAEDTSGDKAFVIVKIGGVLFLCCYFKPNEGVEWLAGKLAAMEEHLTTDLPTVLLGDLNSRHVSLGDHYSNSYGNTLLRFLEHTDLEWIKPSRGRWTFLRGDARSAMDHVRKGH